ncbi:MAG: uncharacterized protein QOI26_85 [Pseudonocardiales bacterium]|nr:uncharacterized protein [Pseudonocardiales bacterium]
MSISADLLSILACPSADHAPLRLETSGDGVEQLVCTSCLSRFPVSDGIAVLLADEAEPGPRGLGVPATGEMPVAGPQAGQAPAGQASAAEADGGAAGHRPGTSG